jgi:hypothetical protein
MGLIGIAVDRLGDYLPITWWSLWTSTGFYGHPPSMEPLTLAEI